ncbi:cell division protein FtsL [Lactococcus hodotermopsidis]|uniref:Cell division protein FtsL n=1 Tax=Pseudolactococcus hodotermopsidis TaxID=2709157 RepID=A0A6A0B8I4_9LACT|nr:cell division protein FtsL [Lactococcus hodotermopsidis]GFH41709.1 cell division protein FtsL [Lactococcus hodotermopsidis]
MAAKPKEYFDIRTAKENGSYNISADSIAPELLRRKFSKLSTVEKVFYLSIIFSAVMLAVGMVFVRTKIIEVEQNTLEIQTEVSTKEDTLKLYDQQINELMNPDRVSGQAKDNGLKSNNENVIKATK